MGLDKVLGAVEMQVFPVVIQDRDTGGTDHGDRWGGEETWILGVFFKVDIT